MKLLFNRVFDGADEMVAVAEKTLNETLKELGPSAPLAMPNTAYFLANHLAYLGKKITTLGELKAAFDETKANWMPRNQRLGDAFKTGFGTVLAGEVVEACKYAKSPTPYGEGDNREYWGHMSDAEVRELGVPLVTGDIPGFVVIIGPAPSDEEAAELIKGYQSRAIFVFLIGGVIDQAKRMKLNMNFSVRVVPVGPELWHVAHIISLVNRAAMIFGNVQPGDQEEFDDYTFKRIRAFVNAYDPLPDLTVAYGGGAIAMGFPVITNSTKDVWPVPKSLIIQKDTKDWIETSLEARDIKIKVTKVDIPVAFSTAFEGEIIRRADMHVDIDGSKGDCFEWVDTKEANEIEDHKIELFGPDLDSVAEGSRWALGIVVEVAGKNMQKDFEPVFERRLHHYLNYAEGVMHTGQRDLIRIRVSKASYAAGFRAKHLGEILYAKLKGDFDAIIDKVQVKIYTKPEDLKRLKADVNKVYAVRDDRLKSLTDENVEVFYNCILCQSFSPAHVCVVTPERLGLCGAVSWLDAKATNEIDPNGSCQIVTKERVVDEKLGIWEDVNEAVQTASHGSLQAVTLYSIMQDPMTSCGCFECICGIEPATNGVVIVNREHSGMTPLGMSFSEMASMTGGGVQTPGFMGHGKQFISSKKFMAAEGGPARIVWMPKALKEFVAAKLNATAKDLYGIDNFVDRIADETVTEDAEKLVEYLTEKEHPVLQLEPLM
ncbi:carbon monoxide dehydrogenase/acetyl-coa synthase subunit alpha (acetyl-coa synthase subunit) (codh/acs) (acs subunit) [Treponema primitia ZAS-2]|uniref:CO-methylating acetyl-CoA synthase n=1 Tax=Treponema primitia (strain ATCC BAA-887 / DSM 12427 / ZAS-2) TaxID=545694 RepID=F5YMN8_TREPZ|nr:acetyl-CoA decarbonylase/synthase complex subunit alpha/beta [Treponema primitia]AEF85971.1 carbon monoxide dehydrogenase/acetyl-coa synthase subunit alpha (acetyl-coa synthase subunit) (codh/acs) (acs subunit) [Treponema primitia ZAS-2]